MAAAWFAGMLLSILPICATVPMNRNLLFVAIGAFGLTAQLIGGFFSKESWVPKSRYRRGLVWTFCVALILVHVGVAAVARTRAPRITSVAFDTFYSTIRVDPSIDLAHKTLVVVNAPNPFLFVGLPSFRAYWQEPLPERPRLLAPAFAPLEITRTGERTLRIQARTGNMFSADTSRREFRPSFAYFHDRLNSLFRPTDRPFKVGEQVKCSDMSVEVTEVSKDGRPTQVSFEFSVSLDDPALCWLQWQWGRRGSGYYSTVTIPAVGETTFAKGPFDRM